MPFAGHKDNHAGLVTLEQMAAFKKQMRIDDGKEWDRFAGLDVDSEELKTFLDSVPFSESVDRSYRSPTIAVPAHFKRPTGERLSTQDAFGRFLSDMAREHPKLADRVVTASPDVTVSTSLGSWLNRRHIFGRRDQGDLFQNERIVSALNWEVSTAGQHIELGIAENNLFILLAALGLSGPLFGERLLPIGTVYDPFISRGLDALNYACYQDARFIIVGTPSGVSLASEGGAHQSIYEPLIGIGQPGLTLFEPTYADELCEILRWSFLHLQADDGGAVYLRLSTRPLEQPKRDFTAALASHVTEGGYWLVPPDNRTEVALVASGAVLPEVIEAHGQLVEDIPGTGLLVVTSVDQLFRGWTSSQQSSPSGTASHAEALLRELPRDAGLVTVMDGHPATLAWLAAVQRHQVMPLGVDKFGQSGDIPDLYREYRLDSDAIVDAVARLCLAKR